MTPQFSGSNDGGENMKIKELSLDAFMRDRLGKVADVYLVRGIRLTGVLISYDQDALFLRGDTQRSQPITMVLWSAITSVSIPEECAG